MVNVQEVNTPENFALWVSMIVPNEKFKVEADDRIKSVTISEVDNEMATTRLEMSAYSFPQFFMWESNRKISYNQSLILVLNKLIAESTYINEISDGLKVITDHRVYQIGTNANAVAKDVNSYVLVDNEFRSNFDVSKKEIREFADRLPMQPASEKSVGDGILVLSNDPIYTGVGYSYKNGVFTSLFPNKSNLPARLKAFMLPTSVSLDRPSENVFKDGDANTMECLVLFVKPGKERHVSGEVWIEKNRFRDITFTQMKRVWYIDTNLKVGHEIIPEDARIMTPFGPNNQFRNALSLKCVDKNPFYMRLEVCHSLNEARITSHTGLKGYSSVQGSIGELYIPNTDGNGDGVILKPDMVCGPSSIKGKVNQIRLAQAAYVAKYIYGYAAGMLDSMDVELINRLASECPVGYWNDQNGCQHECYYGLVHVAFTDPSVQYSRNSKMSFQFEMLKLAMLEYPELADAILDSRDDDKLDVVRELVYLQESLKGNVMTKGVKTFSHSAFNNLRDPKTIIVHRINSTDILPVVNHLVDENRKAFIYTTFKGERIYIPSGKVLKTFESTGANGQWLYDTVIVQLSRIFNSRNRNLDGLTKAVNRYVLTIGNRVVLYPELLGVNMKQTTLYDHQMTVSVPTKNLLSAKREIYGEKYEDWESMDLYAIVVRNPAIWRNQLVIAKVVDGGDCTTVGLSHDIVMHERADNDGDLAPVYFGNERIQNVLSDLYDNQFESTLFEAEWEKIYYAAESDAGLFDDMLDPKKNEYELYSFTTVDLKNRMFDAAIAKTTVGVATTQYWAWSDAVTLYYNKLNGKPRLINGKMVPLKKMSNDVRKELISFYAIILQELVIGAIKHVENGSQGYRRFMLERIAESNEQKKNIRAALQESVPFMLPNSREDTRENQLKSEVSYFLFYISALFDSKHLDIFGDLGQLYSQYNGGKAPTKELDPLVKDTTFYRIISLVDEWRGDCAKPKVDKSALKNVEAPF